MLENWLIISDTEKYKETFRHLSCLFLKTVSLGHQTESESKFLLRELFCLWMEKEPVNHHFATSRKSTDLGIKQ